MSAMAEYRYFKNSLDKGLALCTFLRYGKSCFVATGALRMLNTLSGLLNSPRKKIISPSLHHVVTLFQIQ